MLDLSVKSRETTRPVLSLISRETLRDFAILVCTFMIGWLNKFDNFFSSFIFLELLEVSHDTMIGDFLDPYGFYTVVEDDELKDFVKEKLESINAKLDIKLNIITNKTTLMEICQLLRALAMDNGHMLIYGTSLISAQCVVELACRIKGIRMFKLLDTDITGIHNTQYMVALV